MHRKTRLLRLAALARALSPALLALGGCQTIAQPPASTVIQNATVIDGTGAAPRLASPCCALPCLDVIETENHAIRHQECLCTQIP